jgi:hypothetical protein
MKRIASETIKVFALVLGIGLVSAVLLHTNQALALEPTGETVYCQPGQTANSDLGVCVDPVCGPGTQRDPSGQTRYCVQITCPPGMVLDTNINQCVPNVYYPPGNKCPDGSMGQPYRLSNGVTVIKCPNPLPPPPRPTVRRPPVPGTSGAIMPRGVEGEQPAAPAPSEQTAPSSGGTK